MLNIRQSLKFSFFLVFAFLLISIQKVNAAAIACNANDLFGDGRADTVIIEPKDLEWVLPIYIKYNGEGLDACMAYIAKQMPIDSDITKNFKEAYAEIEIINPKVYSFYPFN